MENYLYNTEAYNATLRSELIKLSVIGILLLMVLIAMAVYSVVLIKEDKRKKFPYVQLIGVAVVSVFLMLSFGRSVISYSKDFADEAYIQYEGPAVISKQRKVVLGNIPTGYDEYVVPLKTTVSRSLYQRERIMEKRATLRIYIVYAQHSGIILELTE